MPRTHLTALPCLLLALVLAACGGSSGSGGAEPASAVPAGAAIYLEGVVRPEGDRREDVLDAAGKLLRTDDPERKIHELVDKAIKESGEGDVTYDDDIAPWLGEKAGIWITGLDRGDKAGYVGLIATKDTDKAEEALDKSAKAQGGKVKQRSYEGVDYQVDEDGVAAGLVGDFLAIGTEAEFKRTVKAKDGRSLAEEKRYTNVTDALEDDRIGHFYIDLKPIFEQVLKADPQAAQQFEQFRSIFPVDKLEPAGGALLANGDRIAFDALMRGPGVSALKAFGPLTGTGTTPLVAELPGDSWAAYGVPRLGPALKTVFDRVAGAFGGAAANQQLRQRYGLDLERDVFSWIGDVAIFARGRDKASLEGALVIQATNPETMRNAFGKLVGLIQTEGGQKLKAVKVRGAATAFEARGTDLPKPIVLARSEDRVVVGYGEAAAADALAPSDRLGESKLYDEAKTLLEDYEPTFLLSMPDLLAAIDSTRPSDPDYAKAKPYLEAFTVVASGGKAGDDELRSRFAAGLK